MAGTWLRPGYINIARTIQSNSVSKIIVIGINSRSIVTPDPFLVAVCVILDCQIIVACAAAPAVSCDISVTRIV